MRIGIDIDEIIAEFLDQFLVFYHEKTGKLLSKNDFHSYNFEEILGGTKEEAIEIVREFYASEYFDNIKPVEKARDSIKNLINSHEIFLITSRHGVAKEKTTPWIKEYFGNIPIEIIYTDDFSQAKRNKSQICKELGIGIIVEDHKDWALRCAKDEIITILFDKPWNKGLEHDNIIRVNNWTDAVKEIEKLSQNS